MHETGFGWALYNLKEGQRVYRTGWNGKGMWLALFEGTDEMSQPYIYIKSVGCGLVPWTASQTDLLATDWEVIDEEVDW